MFCVFKMNIAKLLLEEHFGYVVGSLFSVKSCLKLCVIRLQLCLMVDFIWKNFILQNVENFFDHNIKILYRYWEISNNACPLSLSQVFCVFSSFPNPSIYAWFYLLNHVIWKIVKFLACKYRYVRLISSNIRISSRL